MRVLIAATLLALAACTPSTPAPTTAPPPVHICDDNGKPCRGDVIVPTPN